MKYPFIEIANEIRTLANLSLCFSDGKYDVVWGQKSLILFTSFVKAEAEKFMLLKFYGDMDECNRER